VVRRPLCLVAAAPLAALAVTTVATPATVAPCVGTQLVGSFRAIPGSAGAGNIVYALRLRNRSSRTCFVSGRARLRLLAKTGGPLPTHVIPVPSGRLTAVIVRLPPGRAARATARFSPDVPGPGEPISGRRCEPTAYRLRVTPPPGGGTLVAPITPPTPVCEHGSLQLSVFSAA
jgi:Protein of unknown function (DUF4232)